MDWKIHKGYKRYDSVPKAVGNAYLKQATAFIRAKEEEDAAAAAAVADAATVTAKRNCLNDQDRRRTYVVETDSFEAAFEAVFKDWNMTSHLTLDLTLKLV